MRSWVSRVIRWDLVLTARLTLPVSAGHWRLVLAWLAHSGDSIFWIAGAGLAAVLSQGIGAEVGRRVVWATLVGGGTVWLLKQLFRRQRPSQEHHGLYMGLDVHSFPSGHAGRNACSVMLLSPLVPWPLQIGLFLWLGLMGFARVALGIHYLLDVLAGFAIGGGVGCLVGGMIG